MLETALLTLLSQPSQSIFTLISTVCESEKKRKRSEIKERILKNDCLLKREIKQWTCMYICMRCIYYIPALVFVSFWVWSLLWNSLIESREHPLILFWVVWGWRKSLLLRRWVCLFVRLGLPPMAIFIRGEKLWVQVVLNNWIWFVVHQKMTPSLISRHISSKISSPPQTTGLSVLLMDQTEIN